MSILLPLFAAAALQASAGAPAGAAPGTPYGPETTITFASNGNLREWTRGPNGAGILYVRDRQQRWYQVRTTGPCRLDRALDTLSYTTDPNGTFDRFSRLRVARLPNQNCGVQSIRRSTPPKAYPQPTSRKR
jgi:hypothetical protein